MYMRLILPRRIDTMSRMLNILHIRQEGPVPLYREDGQTPAGVIGQRHPAAAAMYRHINGIVAATRHFVDKAQWPCRAVQRKGADAARTGSPGLGGGIDVLPVRRYIQKRRVHDTRCMAEK